MQGKIEFRLQKSVHNFLLSMKLIIARRHEREVQILFKFFFLKNIIEETSKNNMNTDVALWRFIADELFCF